jgi:hypothetical protein
MAKMEHKRNNNSKTIAFWGAPPPPIGGMTVHIQRFSNLLKKDNWAVVFYNLGNLKETKSAFGAFFSLLKWYLSLVFLPSSRVHYVITTRSYVRFLASVLTVIRGKKVILRVGGRSLENSIENGGLGKLLTIWSLKLCSAFIGVNKDICKLASNYTRSSKIHMIAGFIPPMVDSNTNQIPSSIKHFFKEAEEKVIVTGQIVKWGEDDIYGLWDILPFIEGVKNSGVKCCIISYNFVSDNIIARDLFISEINKRGLSEWLMVYHNEGELWPILNYADVFVRSSHTDGDANSIREALFLGKRVIASSCVRRPSKCELYETNDITDLIATFNKGNTLASPEASTENGNYPKLLSLLDDL